MLWGTHHVLGLPPLSTQTHPAVQLCTTPFNTDQQDADAKMLPPSPRESTQHTATKHNDTHRAGAGSGGMRAVLALAEVSAGARPCFAEFHIFCTCLVEKEVPLLSLRRREKHLNSKRTTVDINLLIFCFVINTYRYL